MPAASHLAVPEPEFYTWAFPGAPVKVHLYLDVVRHLEERLGPGTPGSPVRRGILLGRSNKFGLIEIGGVQALSTADVQELGAALADLKSPDQELGPVGYYRTHDENHLHLGEDDLALARTFFSDPGCVFLLIQATETGPGNAGFFFWDNGHIHADFCFLEFPFEAGLLAGAQPANEGAAPLRPVAVPKPVEPVPAAPGSSAAESPRRVRWRAGWLFAAALVGAAGLGTTFITRAFRKSPAGPARQSAAGIALNVERQGKDLHVTWNRNAKVLADATGGRMSFRDGTATREIDLDEGQLRFGDVVYSPASDQVRVQLDILASGRKAASEAVTVVPPPAPQPRPAQAPPQPAVAKTAPVQTPPAPAVTGKPASSPNPFAPHQPPPGAKPIAPARGSDAPGHFTARLPTPPAAAARRTEAPPVIPKAQAPAAYVPPEPLRKVLPTFPPFAVQSRPVVVEVKVSIDATGRVVRAESWAQPGVSDVLAEAAVKAARSWEFRPARMRNRNVAGEYLLRFKFDPAR